MRQFRMVDVFPSEPLSGNPLAVVVDADGVSDEAMQQFANWMNLSETTFLLPPTDPSADYRVRIFTPAEELPFAGHPTLGSCHVWLDAGGVPKNPQLIFQECTAGLVPIRPQESSLSFGAPELVRFEHTSADELDTIARVLQVDHSDIVASYWLDNGPRWVGALFESAEKVLALSPMASYPEPVYIGAVGPYPDDEPFAYEVRAFFSAGRGDIREDPVTGSLNASIAQWLIGSGRVEAPYSASQGTAIGRAGVINIDCDDSGQVWVEGSVRELVRGSIDL